MNIPHTTALLWGTLGLVEWAVPLLEAPSPGLLQRWGAGGVLTTGACWLGSSSITRAQRPEWQSKDTCCAGAVLLCGAGYVLVRPPGAFSQASHSQQVAGPSAPLLVCCSSAYMP